MRPGAARKSSSSRDKRRDGSAQAARAAGARVLENPGNRGKGYSVRHGMLEAKGEWALFTDADLSAPIEDLEKLWAAAEHRSVRVAIGSRAIDRSLVGVHQPAFREAMGRVFNLAMRAITGLPYRDTQCGFKLFEASAAREIFSRQRLDGFGFDVEVLFIARLLGYREIEVAVKWNDVAGTKVSTWRGVARFWIRCWCGGTRSRGGMREKLVAHALACCCRLQPTDGELKFAAAR
jgi:dolichyl-phosphate beta-glucosyltransferase